MSEVEITKNEAKCPVCPKVYTGKSAASSLYHHKVNQHPESVTVKGQKRGTSTLEFPCSQCSVKFHGRSGKWNLTRHLRTMHGATATTTTVKGNGVVKHHKKLGRPPKIQPPTANTDVDVMQDILNSWAELSPSAKQYLKPQLV